MSDLPCRFNAPAGASHNTSAGQNVMLASFGTFSQQGSQLRGASLWEETGFITPARKGQNCRLEEQKQSVHPHSTVAAVHQEGFPQTAAVS